MLEIQSVDIVHDSRHTNSERLLTFRVELPNDIVRKGVAFADSEGTDALEVFVLTRGSGLFTITLKRDLLVRQTIPSQFDAATCFKKYTSSSLGFRNPYRMVATSSLELLVSLDDGGILRLNRKANENGAHWRETFFSEGGWGNTLRGLVSLKRHQTVRYQDFELESGAATAIAKSPNGKHVWTVSLDHKLRAWSTQTGKAVTYLDLLNENPGENRNRDQKFVMAAEQGTMLQVVDSLTQSDSKSVVRMHDDRHYFLIVHSPKDHQFKFYEVSTRFSSVDAEGEGLQVRDLYPRASLVPPLDELMNTNIWHLEDFHVFPGIDWLNTHIWVRARSGALCRTFTLHFDLLNLDGEPAALEGPWSRGWTVVDLGMHTVDALGTYIDFPGDVEVSEHDAATTPTEAWLRFLFYPERFSTASIETALHVYRRGRNVPNTSTPKGLNASALPLEERLSQAIASKIIVRRLDNERPDYKRYQADIQAQWTAFYSLLAHLHKRRGESIGLSFDHQDGLAWSTYADFLAPIRATGPADTLRLNEHLLAEDAQDSVEELLVERIFPADEDVHNCRLLSTARSFSARLSADFRENFRQRAINEAICHEIRDKVHSEGRVQTLYDESAFGSEVMDDDFSALESSAEHVGGLGNVNEHMILGALELMLRNVEATGTNDGTTLGPYGGRFTIAVAQEMLERDRRTLLDLLMLVVFIYGDLDQADLHPEYVSNIGPLYDALIVRLKHNEMLSWLARNIVTDSSNQDGRAISTGTVQQDKAEVTLLERIFIGDWKALSVAGASYAERLNAWSQHWVYGARLYDEWDGVTGHILAVMIKEQTYDLAVDFQRFLSQGEDSSNWLRYLEGQLLVATGEYALASSKFKAAADGMSEATMISSLDTANLLTPDEQSEFGDGYSSFFQHVLGVFEKLKIYSYAADFARLALESLDDGSSDLGRSLADLDRKKAMSDSPTLMKVDNNLEQIRIMKALDEKQSEIRSRLFNALLQTGRFHEAFNALTGINKEPLKKANLAGLIKACVEQDAVPMLLELPFAEADLVKEADTILLTSAKKSLASGNGASRPYHQILYAFRTQLQDFRGAAEILYEHLQRLRHSQTKTGILDPEEETLVQAYVLLINSLACCGEDNAWLLADPIEGVNAPGAKRKLVTIADVRREYGIALDQRNDLLHGRFALVGGGVEMDVL